LVAIYVNQSAVDDAVHEWHTILQAYVNAEGAYFEQSLNDHNRQC